MPANHETPRMNCFATSLFPLHVRADGHISSDGEEMQMRGTEKQIAWATDIRAMLEPAMLRQLDAMVEPEDRAQARIEATGRFDELDAEWWIENRNKTASIALENAMRTLDRT